MKRRISLITKASEDMFRAYMNIYTRKLEFLWQLVDANEKEILPPCFTKNKKYTTSIEMINGNRCYVISPKGKKTIHAVMYIHGGGFISQIALLHWLFIRMLIDKTNCTVYVPIYPLANPYYSSAQDTTQMLIDTYRLMIKHHSHKNITIMGDSAGAVLSLVVGQQIKVNKLKRPKNIISISPLTRCDLSENEVNAMKHDAILPEPMLLMSEQWYVKKNDDRKNPLYSPFYGDSKNIGLITIFIGTNDSFINSCRQYHQKLIHQKITHNFVEGKGLFHIYPLFAIPEAKNAVDLIIKLITA